MTFDLGQGHVGCTGVKKVIFTKKEFKLIYVLSYGHVTHAHVKA